MNPRIALATAHRVLRQVRRDPRTIALLIAVPCLLLVLLKYVLDDRATTFQTIGVPLLGLFPMISMFLVTSITMLRERATGTLERLMTMPLSKIDILLGYGIAFGILAAIQATVVSIVGFLLLGLDVPHSPVLVVGLAILNALLGMSMGLFLSALARTEFQAVQFMPAFVFPQLLLCGLLVPRPDMASVLEAASALLPMTYAYEALVSVTSPGDLGSGVVRDALATVAFMVAALALGAPTLRRRTP